MTEKIKHHDGFPYFIPAESDKEAMQHEKKSGFQLLDISNSERKDSKYRIQEKQIHAADGRAEKTDFMKRSMKTAKTQSRRDTHL